MRILALLAVVCFAATAAEPDAEMLLGLERRTFEAYASGNGAYFAEILRDDVVMTAVGRRLPKAAVVRLVGAMKCNLSQGWSFGEPNLRKLDSDVYLLTYVGRVEGTCTLNGTTEKLPSPIRVATVWTKGAGDKWQAAFHAENTVIEPAALTVMAQPPPPPPSQTNTLTTSLLVAENAIWDAWKAKDSKRITALTIADLSFVNIFGTYFATKAEVIRDWTGPLCDVRGLTLAGANGTSISPNVAVLTVTGSIDGTCGGQKPPPVYGATVYVKNGDT